MDRFRPFGLLVLLLATTPLGGCGPSPGAVGAGVAAPHRGALLRLPDNLGYAEVVAEPTSGSAKNASIELATYFLTPDAQAALTPAPTAVTLEVVLAEAKTRQAVPLTLKPKANDPAGATRFAAIPPPGFDGVITGGKLSAQVAGRAVDISF